MRFIARARFLACLLACLLGAALLLTACGGTFPAAAPPPGGEGPFEPPAAVDLRLNTDPAGEELSVFPRLATNGDALYATWYDRRNGNTDVFFNRSLDGGREWLASDRRLDTDLPGAAGSNVPQIAASRTYVFVAWEDQRNGLSEIRFNRSLDGGDHWWPADVRVDRSTPRNGSSLDVDIAAAGRNVYVVWQDNRNGAWDVYFNRSLDAGETWLGEDLRLDTDPAGEADSVLPRLACRGDEVWVVWQDERDGEGDIRLNRSEDGGATWLANDQRLDTDLPGAAASLRPRIAVSDDVVAVAWSDDRDGAFDIRANASSDGGTSFLAVDRRVETDAPGADDSQRCEIAVRGRAVYVTWEDERFGLPNVFFNHSVDGGKSWGLLDVRVNTSPPGSAMAIQPVVAVGTSHVFVAWADDREGRFDVLVSTSEDDGVTWRDPEFRMNTDTLGASNALAPSLVVTEERARVVWYDDRFGPGDIYFNLAGP